MSVNRSQVIEALRVVEVLRAHGFSVIIAGGFARDVYFDEVPKDIDIVVGAGSIHKDPAEAHKILNDVLRQNGVDHVGFRMYSESASDRLIGGFKCVGNLDVVLYDVKYAAEAVAAFDFNLNQFVLIRDDQLKEAYVVFAGDESWHELIPVREDYTPERFGKMREKFLNLTWRYPENEGPARVYLKDAILAIE